MIRLSSKGSVQLALNFTRCQAAEIRRPGPDHSKPLDLPACSCSSVHGTITDQFMTNWTGHYAPWFAGMKASHKKLTVNFGVAQTILYKYTEYLLPVKANWKSILKEVYNKMGLKPSLIFNVLRQFFNFAF